jgi:PST family polysaccharide transporter
MLSWSLISAPFSILAIVIGLRWGAFGVAASYSVVRVLMINPLMFWFIGRSGPVRTSDFYRLLTPFTLAAISVILGCSVFRYFVPIANPLIGLIACSLVGGVSALLALIAIPGGRSAITDIKRSLHLLRPEPPRQNPEHA